jgi:hypothetical protein
MARDGRRLSSKRRVVAVWTLAYYEPSVRLDRCRVAADTCAPQIFCACSKMDGLSVSNCEFSR